MFHIKTKGPYLDAKKQTSLFGLELCKRPRTWERPPGHLETWLKKKKLLGFPGGAVVENLPANAGDTGSSPGPGRSHMPRSNWAREPQLLSLRV